MIVEKKRLFNPYVGEEYEKGINGKKILVVGASFYCNEKQCDHFNKCTNKESRLYNKNCTAYQKISRFLEDSPEIEIDEGHRAYKRFAKDMLNILGIESNDDYYETFWCKVAFTNYIQNILPSWKTYSSYCSDVDIEALSEVIEDLKPMPDVIIVWGSIVSEPIKRNLCYDVDNQNATSGYVCHIKKGEKDIVLLNTYHPAYSKYKDNGNLEKYVKEVFCI